MVLIRLTDRLAVQYLRGARPRNPRAAEQYDLGYEALRAYLDHVEDCGRCQRAEREWQLGFDRRRCTQGVTLFREAALYGRKVAEYDALDARQAQRDWQAANR